MNPFSRRFSFLLPVLFLGGLLLFDQVLRIDFFLEPRISYKKIEPSIYDSRNDLFEQMKQELAESPGSSPGIVFGSSRSAAFSMADWEKKLQLKVYNFSAPLATPSYYYFWLTQFLEAKITPDFIAMELDPVLFTTQAEAFPLRYGYTPSFVIKNIDYFQPDGADPWTYENPGFSRSQVNSFFLTRLFSTNEYPVDLSVIRENQKEISFSSDTTVIRTDATGFKSWYRNVLKTEINRKLRGSIPALPFFTPVSGGLEMDAQKTVIRFQLHDYRPSVTQFTFLKRLLELASERQIRLLIFEPPVYTPLAREIAKIQVFGVPFQSGLESLVRKKAPFALQMRPQLAPLFQCREFKDSMHLAEKCYENLSSILLEGLP